MRLNIGGRQPALLGLGAAVVLSLSAMSTVDAADSSLADSADRSATNIAVCHMGRSEFRLLNISPRNARRHLSNHANDKLAEGGECITPPPCSFDIASHVAEDSIVVMEEDEGSCTVTGLSESNSSVSQDVTVSWDENTNTHTVVVTDNADGQSIVFPLSDGVEGDACAVQMGCLDYATADQFYGIPISVQLLQPQAARTDDGRGAIGQTTPIGREKQK